MNTYRSKTKSSGSFIVLSLILFLCCAVSASLLFGRVIPYTAAKFVNVHSLTENGQTDSNTTAYDNNSSLSDTSEQNNSSGQGNITDHNPQFSMEAEEEIFKLSYDETGKITVIGAEGNEDKLIAPGTSNLYQFTLANTGNTALDYTMTMEAYVTGTDLYLPVNVRVWDYTNKFLLGSADKMVDVLELNTVEDSAELGAGRYAVYNLEWEWPFEWGNDEYDTMLGNLAVGDDLVLHIVIRTVAEYDENPDNPNAGLFEPPNTGDDFPIILLSLLCGGSFIGFCVMIFSFFKSGRKRKAG